MISQIVFLLLLGVAVFFFVGNMKKIQRRIALGKNKVINDQPAERWATMARVALGQTKMMVRPVPGILHFLVYAGFILINIEVLEIVIDGLFNTHRVFAPALGSFYGFLIGFFEILALSVWGACVIFLIRRNVLRLKRFRGIEMPGWPTEDANIILAAEIVLMTAFLVMNAADYRLQQAGATGFEHYGGFAVSRVFAALLPDNITILEYIERTCWWLHIIGILAFLNYLPYSKHFHIILAFPNTWYSNLGPKGRSGNMPSVTLEVKAMLDSSYIPEAKAEPEPHGAVSVSTASAVPEKFGARDVTDLTWKNLMDSYSCTQCGRCTSQCPANITGKLLSPRKIVMDTRKRLDELGAARDSGVTAASNENYLLGNYITPEEIWACTSCNACTEACPVNIDPLAIIVELRRYLVMEESNAPASLNAMFNNVENNGAPWQFSPADRLNWAQQ